MNDAQVIFALLVLLHVHTSYLLTTHIFISSYSGEY